jgi:hypothetical protein
MIIVGMDGVGGVGAVFGRNRSDEDTLTDRPSVRTSIAAARLMSVLDGLMDENCVSFAIVRRIHFSSIAPLLAYYNVLENVF